MAIRAYIPILIAAASLAGAARARGLDQRLIHGYYNDGEFDRVISVLTDYGKGCQCTRQDSVFAEKHLAVVYAANPSTRELGRYHMFLMLDLAPGTDLLDMFVGEEVDAVFEKVRKEHTVRAVAKKPDAKRPVASAFLASRWAAPRPAPAKPAPRIGSENQSQAGAAGPSGLLPARNVPNPFAKSARTLLEGKAPVPVRVAAATPQGPYASAVAPAVYRSNPLPPAASAAPVPVRPSAASRITLNGPAAVVPMPARSRAFPMSAYVPKAPATVAVNPIRSVASTGPGATSATLVLPRAPAATAASAPRSAVAGLPAEKPMWKEPGLWIGGGAALAVVAFTLFTSGGEEKGAASKTYVVPATASK